MTGGPPSRKRVECPPKSPWTWNLRNSFVVFRSLAEIWESFFFFLKIFLTWTILKVFAEFVTILFLFYDLVFWQGGVQELRSRTRDRTCIPCIER